MLTLALYGLLAVVVIGVLYLIAARLLPAGEQIAPPVRDEPLWALPAERALVAADVAEVRLPVALRGYRFAETDLLLDRLVDELRARDEEIARLGGRPATERSGTPADPPAASVGTPVVSAASAAKPSPAARVSPPAKPSAATRVPSPAKVSPPAKPSPRAKADPAAEADLPGKSADQPAAAAGPAAEEPDGHAG